MSQLEHVGLHPEGGFGMKRVVASSFAGRQGQCGHLAAHMCCLLLALSKWFAVHEAMLSRRACAGQVDRIEELAQKASATRSTGMTGANADSSRSHSIMQFALKKAGDVNSRVVGKLSFIDLAGSERGADTYDNDRYL